MTSAALRRELHEAALESREGGGEGGGGGGEGLGLGSFGSTSRWRTFFGDYDAVAALQEDRAGSSASSAASPAASAGICCEADDEERLLPGGGNEDDDDDDIDEGGRGEVAWRQSSKALASGLALIAVAFIAASAIHTRSSSAASVSGARAEAREAAFLSEISIPTANEAVTVNFDGKCLLIENGVDYTQGAGAIAPTHSLDHIPDPQMCCAFCHGVEGCAAWVWKNEGLDGCPYKCWILATAPAPGAAKARIGGVVSGLIPDRPPLRLPVPRTPASALAADGTQYLVVSPEAISEQRNSVHPSRQGCSGERQNCWSGRCCADANRRCFMKSDAWAECRETCVPGSINLAEPKQFQTPWNCTDVSQDAPGVVAREPFMVHPGGPPAGAVLRLPPVQPYQPPPPAVQEPIATSVGTGTGADDISLFCFALVRPEGSSEPALLKAQHEMGTSIFACEGFVVYSNRVFEIAKGVVTVAVEDSLQCEFHEIAWNTNIFLAVWAKVIQQQWFQDFDWVVKVDPDAVFLPDRLPPILREHPTAGYINNCQFGLHGPIEVLARSAVNALAEDFQKSPDGKRPQTCVEAFPQAISGNAQWGEDSFIDVCLRVALNVPAALDNRLMCEAHCDCPDWYWCNNGTGRVAYHPFKQEDMYRQCVANAVFGTSPGL